MECKDIINNSIFLAENLNGITLEKNDFDSTGKVAANWRGRLVQLAKLPGLGILTSLAAVLVNVIRLTISAVAAPILTLATLVFGNKLSNTLTLSAYGGIGLSLASLLFSTANIATLGFFNWRIDFTAKD